MPKIKHTVKIGDPNTIGRETWSSETDYASRKDQRLEELWEERHKLIRHIKDLLSDRGLPPHKRAEGKKKIQELEAENRAEGYITNAEAKKEDAAIASAAARREEFVKGVELPMRLGANNPDLEGGSYVPSADYIKEEVLPEEKTLHKKWEATRKVTSTGGRLAQLKEYRELEKKKEQKRQQAQNVKGLVAQRAIARGQTSTNTRPVEKGAASPVTSSPLPVARATPAQNTGVRGSRVAKPQPKDASARDGPRSATRTYSPPAHKIGASMVVSRPDSPVKAAPTTSEQNSTAARPRAKTPVAKVGHGHGATAPSRHAIASGSSKPTRQEATQSSKRTRAASLANLSFEDMKDSNSRNQKYLQDFYSARYKDYDWVQEEKEYIEKKIDGLIAEGSHSVEQRVKAEYHLWGTDRRLADLMDKAKVYFAKSDA